MDKKIVLEELIRMRELMGMKVLSETRNKISRNLLLEVSKAFDNLGLSPNSVDNLTKTVGDFTKNLGKLSDEFTNRGITTMDDLARVVGDKQGIMVADDVTDDMIKAYIKNDQALYSSILKRASDAAAERVKVLLKNVDLKSVFKDESQLNKYLTIISTPIGPRTADEISNQLNQSIDELEGAIKTIKSKGQTVPNDLLELLENFYGKKIDLSNYKSKTTSSPMVKSVDNASGKLENEINSILDEINDPKLKEDYSKVSQKDKDFINNKVSKLSDDEANGVMDNIKNTCGLKEAVDPYKVRTWCGVISDVIKEFSTSKKSFPGGIISLSLGIGLVYGIYYFASGGEAETPYIPTMNSFKEYIVTDWGNEYTGEETFRKQDSFYIVSDGSYDFYYVYELGTFKPIRTVTL